LSPIGLPFFKDSGDNEIICKANIDLKCYYYGSKEGGLESAIMDVVTNRLLHFQQFRFKLTLPLIITTHFQVLVPVKTPNATTTGLADINSNFMLHLL